MRGRSFEGGGKRVRGLADIPYGGEPITNRQTLPIAVRFDLLLCRIYCPADCLVDAHWLNTLSIPTS